MISLTVTAGARPAVTRIEPTANSMASTATWIPLFIGLPLFDAPDVASIRWTPFRSLSRRSLVYTTDARWGDRSWRPGRRARRSTGQSKSVLIVSFVFRAGRGAPTTSVQKAFRLYGELMTPAGWWTVTSALITPWVVPGRHRLSRMVQ